MWINRMLREGKSRYMCYESRTGRTTISPSSRPHYEIDAVEEDSGLLRELRRSIGFERHCDEFGDCAPESL